MKRSILIAALWTLLAHSASGQTLYHVDSSEGVWSRLVVSIASGTNPPINAVLVTGDGAKFARIGAPLLVRITPYKDSNLYQNFELDSVSAIHGDTLVISKRKLSNSSQLQWLNGSLVTAVNADGIIISQLQGKAQSAIGVPDTTGHAGQWLKDVAVTGPAWNALPASTGVSSFNTRTGAVIPVNGDYAFSNISGTAAVTQGGTGLSSIASGKMLFASGSNVLAALTLGTGLQINSSMISVYLSPFSTSDLSEGSRLYYTDARARASISATAPVLYNSSTGVISETQATSLNDGWLSASDWNRFNTASIGLPDTTSHAGQYLRHPAGGTFDWSTPAGSGWLLLGNAGTTFATNFIGTTDAINLQFQVNSFQSGIIQYATTLNTGLGYKVLLANTSGGSNVGLGWNALVANTSGGNNTAIGTSALVANTTASQNTAVGSGALAATTTGASNTAMGYRAMYANTTGQNNTAFGWSALKNTTTGQSNTAVGLEALITNTTGQSNTGVGYDALVFNTTGSSNTAVGYQALQLNTTGSTNTSIGKQALNGNTTGSNNVGVGDETFLTNVTGSNNTAIGTLADVGSDGLTNATAIGFTASVATSNTIQLGNSSVTSVNTKIAYAINGTNVLSGTTLGSGITASSLTSVGTLTALTTAGIITSGGVVTAPGFTSTGALVLKYAHISSTPYTLSGTDCVLGVDCSGGAKTVNLPTSPVAGRTFTVKDESGNAGANNITIKTTDGSTIDGTAGATGYVISANRASVQLYTDGSNWFIY